MKFFVKEKSTVRKNTSGCGLNFKWRLYPGYYVPHSSSSLKNGQGLLMKLGTVSGISVMLFYTSVNYISCCLESLTAEDIIKLDIIKKEVLLADRTLEQCKARVNKYLQWVSEVRRIKKILEHRGMLVL